jgi:hypothetical protein
MGGTVKDPETRIGPIILGPRDDDDISVGNIGDVFDEHIAREVAECHPVDGTLVEYRQSLLTGVCRSNE